MVMPMLDPDIQKRIDTWLNGPIDTESRNEILALQKNDPKTLSDSFYSTLSFGTGGMRGLMGVGSKRMNRYTVRFATQGLANYLLKQEGRSRHVFIGYDNRINSQEFAMESARVLAGNGISVYLTCEMSPVPFVSFGVRQKNCAAGIMITASHNPKEYNGYKVYWSDGAQVVSPHDNGIIEEVEKISRFDEVKLSSEKSPLIEILDPELDLEYLEAIHSLQVDPKEDKKVGDQLKIIYTPLHGTGLKLVTKALRSWGFTNISLVDHQSVPDGNFPTVKSPNPESAEALSMGIKQLENTLSDILIATDPDADRIGVVVLHEEKGHLLNGNQIATICLEYICMMLQARGALPKDGAVITTIVSTDLLGKIAASYNLAFFEVLTGFKYIGEMIHNWEKENAPFQFLFGAEESYGALFGTHARDKDAIVLSCLVAEIALLMKVEGRTLIDFLEEIYKKYGYFLEKQKLLDFPHGQEGLEKMNALMEKMRANPEKMINGQAVTLFEDYKTGIRKTKGQEEILTLPKSNVLLFRLEDGSKIVIRPSGTEPKLKIYLGVFAPSEEGSERCETKMEKLLDALSTLIQ